MSDRQRLASITRGGEKLLRHFGYGHDYREPDLVYTSFGLRFMVIYLDYKANPKAQLQLHKLVSALLKGGSAGPEGFGCETTDANEDTIIALDRMPRDMFIAMCNYSVLGR